MIDMVKKHEPSIYKFYKTYTLQSDCDGACIWASGEEGDRLIDLSLFARDGVIELNMERFKEIGLDHEGFMRFKLKAAKKA